MQACAGSVEEANQWNALVIRSGHLWVSSEKIGLIENGEVSSLATKLKIATLDDDGNLYSLDGASLYLRLEALNGGGQIRADSHPHAVERFKKLADGSES